MSVLLYRLGKFAYGKPWYVIGGWLAVLAAVVLLLVTHPVKLSNEVRIDGTPSQKVIDGLATSLPEASGGQGMLLFTAPEGARIDDEKVRSALLAAVDAVYRHDHVIDVRKALAREAAKGENSPLLRAQAAVAQAAGPPSSGKTPVPLQQSGQPVPGVVVSVDGSTALMQFQFDEQTFELPAGTIDSTIRAAERQAAPADLEVLPSAAMMEIPDIIGVGEIVGVAVAALVLLVTLGSVVAAGLPLIIALTGVTVGVGGAFTLSSVFEIHSLAAVLALMLGLAVGIDYALFIVNRERRLILDQGMDPQEATSRALGTAGSAVFFAGSTVVIALAGLLVIGITLLSTMAVVAAGTIAIAVLLALTLLPALLGLAKDRVCPARTRRRERERPGGSARAVRWGALLVRHRYAALAASILIPAILAVPAAGMKLGLPSGASYDTGTGQRRSYDLVSDAYGPGYNGPLLIAVSSTANGRPLTPATLASVTSDLRSVKGATAVSLAGLNRTGTTAVLSLIPGSGPNDDATKDLATALRDKGAQIRAAHGADIGIAGFTTLAIDVSDRLADVLPLYVATVLGLSLIVLLLVFRSLMVPVTATLGFLLSIAATFGLTTAVFQWGWLQSLIGLDATAPVVSLLPIIITGVLYGLAMDYQMFLVTSIREAHVHGATALDATVTGFARAGSVVLAAATIMVSVFAGFVFNAQPMIKQAGFALAAGILIDAFVIRMTFIPATMALARERAWWIPARLNRLLPDLDVEGDKLAQKVDRSAQLPDEGA
ncbi:MMPL family transporter [Streptomyces acidiscabies]|uniref:MMPL family transporter n=1 Tax=Streptomyces acidiscabies TaxID=42234 RepID=A0AAP6EK71_9ACTN|nr:MMPL family transporter [Streptomyces acidiscabies]MBP5942277.1 MMPL family transporter [Streptomyces sp. LBUM 1476]MBZ3913810.1 MMPL family transporter [Streptomyces acidiscabies]MDX2965285.1 MMPL family transporter [Streptomyces acidiscabies]MDX3022099.1 MMPL family transporter [Streptomyces acidiscabies]MDX3793663.1 MMPL family transporter [Streptomyces acidiscabies]